MDILVKFAVRGGIGFLLGLAAIWWVEPTTNGGVILLIAISLVVTTVSMELSRHAFGGKSWTEGRSFVETYLLRSHTARVSRHTSDTNEAAELRPQPEESTVSSPSRRTKVFISYSHADKEWLERLKRHLKPLVREGYLDCWDDTHIKAGDDWQQEIRTALDRAQVAVLLISADFFASEFIDENELPPLLAAAQAKGVRILPVILSASRFAREPDLARFQAVNPPDRPLNEMPKAEQEKVLDRLAQTIESAFLKA